MNRMLLVAIALLVPGALVLASCRDDSKKPASDEAYVAGFCQASLRMSESMARLTPAPAGSVQPEYLKEMAPIFRQFANDLAKVDAPADLAKYHETFVAELKKAAEQLDKGDTTVDAFLGLERLAPPPASAERLAPFAARNADCAKAGVSFGSGGATNTPAPPSSTFSPPVLDYGDPAKFLAAGPQSSLSPASLAAVDAGIGAGVSGLRGIGRIHAWMAATFRASAGGGATIGTAEVNQLIAGRALNGCHDWALVLSTVARHYGYPAVMVDTAGIAWAKDFAAGATQSFAGHVFAEILVADDWILVDCTSGRYTADYDATNPAIGYTGAGDATGFYALYKGTDPASYGVTSNAALQQRMAAFAAALPGLRLVVPAYRWQPLP